ncbi:VapC toxin family PIN domain ribonuclease [Natrinema sp. CBA1119]|uniref:type II toxin-antitoxin system VapC family toxin n=1 Tax=Natrinema sp. CBA1119 TaxID=1608465 RepID=UPI000BF95E91|nr:PIN domain-containing protein [Natrinema sp. CBA1119]PGF14744.1 VapC toxin family PIN domain ribonuclease [Natrinema sp. CBA1119]
MARAVVDANVFIGARLSRDQNHERAAAILEAFDRGALPTAYVLSDVLEESINYLQARSTHDVAVQTLDALIESSGFKIVHTPKRDVDSGRSLFRKYESLSLTDAVIAASMRRQELEYLYSLDDGFDAVDGITRLTTPANPFE